MKWLCIMISAAVTYKLSAIYFVHFQMENQVVVSDYTQMDRVLREERQYILEICKKIKKAGCNVLLIQKSILRFVQLVVSF